MMPTVSPHQNVVFTEGLYSKLANNKNLMVTESSQLNVVYLEIDGGNRGTAFQLLCEDRNQFYVLP